MSRISRYIRVVTPPPPPPVLTICERIATNQRGSLRFLQINEIAAVKDVDIWEGADSLATGIHQKYMYEADAALPFPTVPATDEGATTGSSAPGGTNFPGAVADLILAFVSSVGTVAPSYIWDFPVQSLVGTLEAEVIDAGQDVTRMRAVTVPQPASTGNNTWSFGALNTLGLGTAIQLRYGVLDVVASSEVAGAAPSDTVLPTEDQSRVVACFVYQGTTAAPTLVMEASEGWTTHRTISLSNAGGTLHGIMVLASKQVATAATVTATAAVGNHDGSNTTSIILASISPTGSIDSVWQQWILMKDLGGGSSGVFDDGEVLDLQ